MRWREGETERRRNGKTERRRAGLQLWKLCGDRQEINRGGGKGRKGQYVLKKAQDKKSLLSASRHVGR